MSSWLPNPEIVERPAYRSIAAAIIDAIGEKKLRPGARLPTHRKLAFHLGVSVQTVSRAYEELIRLGVISGEIGRGSFVRSIPDETAQPFTADSYDEPMIECSILKPAGEQFHADMLSAALRELADDLPIGDVHSFRPSTTQGLPRKAAVKWLRRCGVSTVPESVLITNGNTSAMTIALMMAANHGEIVATEEIGHHTLKQLARYLGIRLMPIAMDDEGIIPENLEQVCRVNRISAVYLMPAGLNPKAFTMGIERRMAIKKIAEEHDLCIIENDAWGPLQRNRCNPFAALCPERTLYFTGFTKCIMPGLRTGYLVSPDRLREEAQNRHLVSNWIATPLVTELTTRWILDGTAKKLLRWQRSAMAKRNKLAARILRNTRFNASSNGLHVWLPLPEQWSEEAFVECAKKHGVAVAAGSSFSTGDADQRPGVRISLAATDAVALQAGLETIVWLLKEQHSGESDARRPGHPVGKRRHKHKLS